MAPKKAPKLEGGLVRLWPTLGYIVPEFFSQLSAVCCDICNDDYEQEPNPARYFAILPYHLTAAQFAVVRCTPDVLERAFIPTITHIFTTEREHFLQIPDSSRLITGTPEAGNKVIMSEETNMSFCNLLESLGVTVKDLEAMRPPATANTQGAASSSKPSSSKAPASSDKTKPHACTHGSNCKDGFADYGVFMTGPPPDHKVVILDHNPNEPAPNGNTKAGTANLKTSADQTKADGKCKAKGKGKEKAVDCAASEIAANPRTDWDTKHYKSLLTRPGNQQQTRAPESQSSQDHIDAFQDPPNVHDPNFHRDFCHCCPRHLVEKGGPVFGNIQQNLPMTGNAGASNDFRMTYEYDAEVTQHCCMHDCQRCFLAYMGYTKLEQLQTIALSGPILKHLPIAYALLNPTKDGEYPNLGDICQMCSYALTYLFHPQTRRMIPNTMELIEAYYIPKGTDLGPEDIADIAAIPPMKDIKTRAELLAAVILSCFADLMDAEIISQERYDTTYPKYATALEDKNPWREEFFHVKMTDIKDIVWPFWGPIPNACLCGKPNCTSGEHDVEVYHRVLSLLRWTVKEAVDAKQYYDGRWGLGKEFRGSYDRESLFRLADDQLVEPAPAPVPPVPKPAPVVITTQIRTGGLRGAERAAFLKDKKDELLGKATHLTVELFQDQIRAAKILSLGRPAGLLRPAVMAASTHNDSFPENGTDADKEAWVVRFEAYLWNVLEVGGLKKKDNPDLHANILWFARYRARSEFGFNPAISEAEQQAAVADTRQYLSDACLQNLSDADSQAMELREMRVVIALAKLKQDGSVYLHMPKGMSTQEYEQWSMDTLRPMFQIFELGGMPEGDTRCLFKALSLFIFYTWFAVRTENILMRAEAPTEKEMSDWGDQLFASATNRVELEVYFKGKLSQRVRKIMLEGIIAACNPGEEWLSGNSLAVGMGRL